MKKSNIIVTILLFTINTASFAYGIWGASKGNASTKVKRTITVPNAKSFDYNAAQTNKCYVSSSSTCNGKSMSKYNWSNDPNTYWSSVNNSMSNNSAWSAPQASVSAQLPSSASSYAYQASPQTYAQPAQTQAAAPQYTNTSGTLTQTDNANNNASGGGFFIS